jgi:neutral amino acid transport system permease protein
LSWLPFFDDRGRLHLLIAAPIAVALGGLFGWGLDAVLWAPLRKRGIGLVTQLVVSVGLSILLKNFFQLRFGGRAKPLNDFADQVQWKWGPVGITPRDFTTAMISLVVLVAVALALQRTRLGKATRAVSDNVDLASATGIDSKKVIRLVWFVGGALAALGGIIRALDEQANFDMGANLLGGLGSAFGALLGGFIIGILTELLSLAVPSELKAVPPLLILVFMLLVRPQGLLGSKERVG